MGDEITNRVANSSLVSLDLEEFYHSGERVVFDLKDYLFQELILKENEFRKSLEILDWGKYRNKNVAILCSSDAIIPSWAFMLVALHLEPVAHYFTFGSLTDLENSLFQFVLNKIDTDKFIDAKVVIKGCGKLPVPISAYVEITRLLRPVATSVMYGEPCSTVPLYKKKK